MTSVKGISRQLRSHQSNLPSHLLHTETSRAVNCPKRESARRSNSTATASSATLGVVRGIIVRSRSVPGTIGAGLQTPIGGNITLLTDQCEKTRGESFEVDHTWSPGGRSSLGGLDLFVRAGCCLPCTFCCCFSCSCCICRVCCWCCCSICRLLVSSAFCCSSLW